MDGNQNEPSVKQRLDTPWAVITNISTWHDCRDSLTDNPAMVFSEYCGLVTQVFWLCVFKTLSSVYFGLAGTVSPHAAPISTGYFERYWIVNFGVDMYLYLTEISWLWRSATTTDHVLIEFWHISRPRNELWGESFSNIWKEERRFSP